MPTPPRDPPPTATVVAAAVPAPLVQVAAPFPGWCPGVQPGSSTSGVIPMEHDNEKRDEYPLSTHAPPVPVPVPGLALQPMEPAHGPRRGMAGGAWPVDYARAAISMDLERQHLAGLMRYDPFAEPTTEELGTPPGQHCFHPWLGAQVADPFIDRTPMPPELAAALLRDTSYQPGSRPVHFRSPSMSRASRVFKEIIIRDPATNQFDTRQRRGKSVDFWHNSGGNRASTWLPKDNPVVKRRYGAIERLVPPEQGGKTRRTTVLNYHEYSLVDDEGDTRSILYHVIPSRKQIKARQIGAAAAGTVPMLRAPPIVTAGRGADVITMTAFDSPDTDVSSVGSPAETTVGTASDTSAPLPPAVQLPARQQQQQQQHATAPAAATVATTVPTSSSKRPRAKQGSRLKRSAAATGSLHEMLVLDAPASTPTVCYMDFCKGANSIGNISENRTGGLVLNSVGGDVAEYHEVAEGEPPLQEGDVVGVVHGLLSLRAAATAPMLGVVTRKAMVSGSARGNRPSNGHEEDTIAYIGRVPVRVVGAVRVGDKITASGRNDGTGRRANSPQQPIVGTVMSLGQPSIGGQPWAVEIVVNPPSAASRRRRSGLLPDSCSRVTPILAGIAMSALTVAAILCSTSRPTVTGAKAPNAAAQLPHGAHTDDIRPNSGADVPLIDSMPCSRGSYDKMTTSCVADIRSYSPYSRYDGDSNRVGSADQLCKAPDCAPTLMSFVNSCWELTNITDDEVWPENLLPFDAVFTFFCVNNYDSSLQIANLVPSSQPTVDSGGLPLALCDRTERHLSRACAQCGTETCRNRDEETLQASCPCLMQPACHAAISAAARAYDQCRSDGAAWTDRLPRYTLAVLYSFSDTRKHRQLHLPLLIGG
jgi:hypothetical protein